MVRSILSAPGWLVFIGLVVVFPALVLLVQVGIRRRWPALARGEHNDVVGFIIAVVGVIYAVLLAFVVIVAWESFTRAEEVVGQEASALRTLYRDSVGLPAESQAEMRGLVLQYATEVVEDSWPAMADGQPGDPEAGDVLQEMADVLAATPVTTPGQQEFVGAEVDRLNELVSLRSQRLDFVESGIPASLWIALVVGALVTVGFALLFGLERTALHLVMVGSLAVLIGVLLFVAVGFNFPFAGDVAVHPTAFERVLDDFGSPADGD
ncbi:DUF4239 domain-containing protein [Geodermatophilus sp. SYSU D01062]